MGRRWGKTVMGGALSLATASQGGKVAWIVPTYKNGRSLWRWAERAISPLRQAKRASSNKTERTIEFDNGGIFGIFSADNEDAIRGEDFHLVVLDEAARISEGAWTDAIQPTLADHDGDAILISTPRGLNWFFREWMRGKDAMNGDYASWKSPTSANPNPKIRKAFLLAKDRVPQRTYEQEWLAEFVEDGAFFQGVDAAAIIDKPDDPEAHKSHYVVGGLDWALSEDFTCLTLACRECNRVIYWDRFNQLDYTYQRERIQAACKKYNVKALLPERNSIGQPNIEMLMQAKLNIAAGPDGAPGFNTSATTKPPLIIKLANALQHDGFKVPREYADELRSYQVEVTTTNPKFSAPSGMHDDRVISLALTWWAMTMYSRYGGIHA